MNTLVVGDTTPILSLLKNQKRFLLIDDGEMIDSLTFPKHWDVEYFDVREHHFNPLKGMTYLKAREFVSILDAVFPEGENTLTKKTTRFVLLSALLEHPTRLSHLFHRKTEENADAYQKIHTLLLSPVLKSVLSKPINFSPDGVLLVRLNRAELGDFDCFVLGNLLISLYQGQVVIPDFGFYGAAHHTALIRQHRLIAGVRYLDETTLTNDLLLMDRVGSKCLFKDAEVLADFQGLTKGTNEYNEAVQRLMGV